MVNFEHMAGDARLVAEIAGAIDDVTVDARAGYGTSQDTLDHFKKLSLETPPGVSIDVSSEGTQTDKQGIEVPIEAVRVNLSSEGEAVYLKSAHANELVHRLTIKEIGDLALRNPGLLQRLGIGQLVYCDVDRQGSDANIWHAQPEFRDHPIVTYLRYVARNKEFEWDHRVCVDGQVREPETDSARMSQELINELRPTKVYPLHNAALTGPHSLVAGELPDLAHNMSGFLGNLYEHFPGGSVDVPGAVPLAEYVHKLPTWQELSSSDDPIAKALVQGSRQDSFGYARDVVGADKVMGSIMEVPYFLPLNYLSEQSSGLTSDDVATQVLDGGERLFESMQGWFDQARRFVGGDSLKNLQYLTDVFQARELSKKRDQLKALSRKDEWSVSDVARFNWSHFYWLVPLGALSRIVSQADKNAPFLEDVDARLVQEVELVHHRMRPVLDSPRRLVRAQLGGFLLTQLASVQAAKH